MKTSKPIISDHSATIQSLAALPGYDVNSKKAKQSKIVKCRAIVFEKQTTNVFEIIF